MDSKKKLFNYQELGIRWGYAPANAAENARFIVRKYKIPKTKIGIRKTMVAVQDIEAFEVNWSGRRAA